MGENEAADRTYCMYVYAHRRPLADAWWSFIGDQLDKKKLSDYATALALEMAVEAKKNALAKGLAAALRRTAVRDGSRVYWQTANFSRWGNDPNEITAAAMKALVALDAHDELIPGVLCYFAEHKCGNRWNSTKDTALILLAMCDLLARQDMDLRGSRTMTVVVNDGPRQELRVDDKATSKLTLKGDSLRAGANKIVFEGGPAAAMYRLSLRYRTASRDIAASGNGLTVARSFYLLDGKGGRRLLQPDEAIPRGAHLESEITATRTGHAAMRYVLVDNPKPASCEILPVEDTRFQQGSTAFVLREDKTATVLWHHEQTGGQIVNRCVLHAELAGEFTAAPAQVELMYSPDIRGHSGTFRLRVKDEPGAAVTVKWTHQAPRGESGSFLPRAFLAAILSTRT